MALQGVNRTLRCEVCDQKLPGSQSYGHNVEGVQDVRQHRSVHTDCSWLTRFQRGGTNLADQLAHAFRIVFAFLFGISMDYQVFIISRMREAYDRTRSTPTAVVEGIGRTGRLVTSAALILGLAFVAFSSTPGTEAKMFATALGGGILIDATIIRGLLAPAFVAILGRWNWWLPARPARILGVEASPIHAEAATQTA